MPTLCTVHPSAVATAPVTAGAPVAPVGRPRRRQAASV